MRRLLSFVLVVLGGFGLGMMPAAADVRSVCFNDDTAPDVAIKACGHIISSRRANRDDRAAAYVRRSSAYYRKGEYDRAILNATEAIRLLPNDRAAYRARALAYDRKGDDDRSGADRRKLLQIDSMGKPRQR